MTNPVNDIINRHKGLDSNPVNAIKQKYESLNNPDDTSLDFSPEPPGFFQTLGNIGRIWKYMWDRPEEIGTHFTGEEASNAFKERFKTMIDKYESFSGELPTQLVVGKAALAAAKVVGGGISEVASDPLNTIASIPAALAHGLLEVPSQAITGYKVDPETKEVVPLTADEAVKSFNESVGAYVGLGIAGISEAKMLGALGKTGEIGADQLYALSQGSKIGRLGKVVAADFGAGALAGVAQGAIGGMGDENQFAQIVNNTLTFAPLGAVFALARFPGIEAGLKRGLINQEAANLLNANELAMLNALRMDTKYNIKDALGNIESFASADNLLDAAIKSKVDIGDGILIPGLSENKILELEAESQAPGRVINRNPEIDDPKLLNILKTRKISPQQKLVEFESNFDKLAFLISSQAKKGKKKNYGSYLKAAEKASGLTEKEIIEHGKLVRQRMMEEVAKPNAGRLRSQEEIDILNEEFRKAGETKINSLVEGAAATDYLGDTWKREGDLIVNQKTGEKYNLTSREGQLKLGRSFSDDEVKSNLIPLSRQAVNPAPSLATKSLNVYRGPAGLVLLTKHTLKPQVAEFFQRSAFLPQEIVMDAVSKKAAYIVGIDGDKKLVRLRSTTGKGSEYTRQFHEVRRRADLSISSQHAKVGGKVPIGNPGALTPVTYFNYLYKEFRKDFPLDAIPTENWDNTLLRFMRKHGVSLQDRPYLEAAFYSKIFDDVVSLSDVSEVEALTNLGVSVRKFNNEAREAMGRGLHLAARTAEGNGMYIEPLGGGSYAVKFADGSGKTLGKVKSAEEAIALINKTRQTKGIDLDGGNSNPIPPEAMNVITADHSWNGPSGGNYNWVDKWNMSTLGQLLVPSNDLAATIDNFYNTDFFGIFRSMQEGVLKNRAFLAGPGKLLTEQFEAIRKFSKQQKFTSAQLEQVTDYIESLSRDEIINNLLARKMNPEEIQEAITLAKSVPDVSAVTEFLERVREEGKKGDVVGSKAFMDNMNNVAQATKVDPAVFNAAKRLVEMGKVNDEDVFSAYAVLRLAHAEQFPEAAVTRLEFAGKNKMNPAQIQLARMLDKLYQDSAIVFEIDPKSRLMGYSPHMRMAYATGSNHGSFGIPKDWVRKMNRYGLIQSSHLIRDPLELAYRYLTSGTRYKSGFMDHLAQADEAIDSELRALSAKDPGLVAGVEGKVRQHFKDMVGIPGAEALLQKAIEKSFGGIFGIPKTDSFLALTTLATQGARPGMALRDAANAIMTSYSAFGFEFTRKAFFDSIDSKYMKALEERAIIPTAEPLDIISPQSTAGFARSNPVSRKIIDFGFSASGQRIVYNHALAGIYKTTREIVHRELTKFAEGKQTKKQAYERIGLSVHTPAVQNKFDAFVKAGQPDQAADMLGRWNGKFIINHFGNNNSPIGWNNSAGRLMGQYGSWGSNAIQTFLNMIGRGTVKERSLRMARFTGMNALIAATGATLGVNLWSWMMNPVNYVPNAGIALGLVQDAGKATMMLSNDEGYNDIAWSTINKYIPNAGNKVAQVYLPFSYAVEDWVKAVQVLDDPDGNIAQFGLQALGNSPLNRD